MVSQQPPRPQPQQVASDPGEHQRSFAGFLQCVKDARGNDWISFGSPSPDRQYPVEKARNILREYYGADYYSDRRIGVSKAPMGETSGTLGGYLVPRDFTYQLLSVIAEESFIYPRAQVVPMKSAMTECPNVREELAQPAGTSPFFGGVKFIWGMEDAPTESEPTYSSLVLNAWDLLGYTTVSNEWLGDTGQLGEDYLLRLLGRAAAWYAEYAFLQGTGSATLMPLGILKSPCLISSARATASQIVAADISKMASRMLPSGWQHAIWACSPTCLDQIAKISSYFINADWEHGPGCGYLMNRPMFVTEKLPALGTTGDLVFFDPWLYIIGLRQEIVIDVSPHSAFRTNQTDFRVWMRLDGKPQLAGPITLQDGTTQVSSCIALSA